MDKEYKVGDIVYYISFPLLIKSRITELDDFFFKKDPMAYIFYHIDEPVGHSLSTDDLFDSFDEAKQKLTNIYNDHFNSITDLLVPGETVEELKEEFTQSYKKTTLESDRKRTHGFIRSTWKPGGMTDEDCKEADLWWANNPYPFKQRGVDWFNVYDLL